ncbi:hypothetical protein OG937_18785 [Streptomyces sp. NBC_00510]
MNSDSMTLPGIVPEPDNTGKEKECWGVGCSGLIPSNTGADTQEAWKKALSMGPLVIAEYQRQHNNVAHNAKCQFRDLPPSVHNAATHEGGNPRPALKKDLAALNEALNQGQ